MLGQKEKGNIEDEVVALTVKDEEKDQKGNLNHQGEASHHSEARLQMEHPINLHAISTGTENVEMETNATGGTLANVLISKKGTANLESNVLTLTIPLPHQQLPSLICNKARFFPTI